MPLKYAPQFSCAKQLTKLDHRRCIRSCLCFQFHNRRVVPLPSSHKQLVCSVLENSGSFKNGGRSFTLDWARKLLLAPDWFLHACRRISLYSNNSEREFCFIFGLLRKSNHFYQYKVYVHVQNKINHTFQMKCKTPFNR